MKGQFAGVNTQAKAVWYGNPMCSIFGASCFQKISEYILGCHPGCARRVKEIYCCYQIDTARSIRDLQDRMPCLDFSLTKAQWKKRRASFLRSDGRSAIWVNCGLNPRGIATASLVASKTCNKVANNVAIVFHDYTCN